MEYLVSPPIEDGELKVAEIGVGDIKFIVDPVAIGSKSVGNEDSLGFDLRIILYMAVSSVV